MAVLLFPMVLRTDAWEPIAVLLEPAVLLNKAGRSGGCIAHSGGVVKESESTVGRILGAARYC